MSGPDDQTPITRPELRALAAELLEQLRVMNAQVNEVRERLFAEARQIRWDAKEGAKAKKPGRRITVLHDSPGSKRVERD